MNSSIAGRETVEVEQGDVQLATKIGPPDFPFDLIRREQPRSGSVAADASTANCQHKSDAELVSHCVTASVRAARDARECCLHELAAAIEEMADGILEDWSEANPSRPRHVA